MKEKTNPSAPESGAKKKKKPSFLRRFFGFIGKLILFVLETVLILAVGLYGLGYVITKGPSPTARDLFVMSVRETSAVGFLANLYLSDEEIEQIVVSQKNVDLEQTNTDLITIPDRKQEQQTADGHVRDAWGLVDEDGDGIIVEKVTGEGYSGFMMVVLDPSQVTLGAVPTSFGGRGYTVEQMVQNFGAVAGINAGGFEDPNGSGNGSMPDSMVVVDGKVYCANMGWREGFVGFDEDNIMHVGFPTVDEIKQQRIRCGVSFGPILISNGESAIAEGNISGLNPRTAIGQRSDGAVLLLVIDGRQVISLGATLTDLVEIFQRYGAVNAINLDGGSSTLMWFDGGYINNCASVIGIRPVPTAFIVMGKEGE